MKSEWKVAGRVVSAAIALALAPGCGTLDQDQSSDETDAVEGPITVGPRSVTRLLPATGTTLLGNYPADFVKSGENFEVDTASDAAQTKFVIGFASLLSAPVNVCGAFTCSGEKAGFVLTVPGFQVGVVQAAVNGRRCRAGEQFRVAYTTSTNTIPQSTCDTTRKRI